MKVYLTGYGTPNFYKSLKKLGESALKFGVDKVFLYNDKMLKKTDFYKKNRAILDTIKWAGYCAWKPYFILEAMKKIKNGDALIYCDAGVEVISDVNPLIKICREEGGILLFKNNHKNYKWTKRDCFVFMDADSKKYWNSNQVQASYQVLIKNKKSIKFLKEYLNYCENPNVITFLPNICGKENLPGFERHTADQSIVTNLAVKYGLRLYRDPSQGGNPFKMEKYRVKREWLPYPYEYSKDIDRKAKYGTIFNHHRNVRKIVRFIFSINSKLPRRIKLFTHGVINLFPNEERKKVLRSAKL